MYKFQFVLHRERGASTAKRLKWLTSCRAAVASYCKKCREHKYAVWTKLNCWSFRKAVAKNDYSETCLKRNLRKT